MTDRPRTLAEAVASVRERPEQLRDAIAAFLDEFYEHPDARGESLREEPASIGRVEDAWLGGVAEHLARLWGLEIPDWAENEDRFLNRAVFAGGLESLKPILLAESPIAFRRRQLFVEAQPLRRASMPNPPDPG